MAASLEIVASLTHVAVMLFAAKVGGEVCERFLKQPAVLGELLMGIVVGASGLALIPRESVTISTLAEIGAILLLFEIGLHADLDELLSVGPKALWVAMVGLVVPFVLGFFIARGFGLPDVKAIFLGATLTATSVGITARVLSDIGILDWAESKIVLGAAVVDDVCGLIILAIVVGLAKTGSIEPAAAGLTALIAVGFVVGSIVLGIYATPWLLKMASKMQTRAAVISLVFIFVIVMSVMSAQLAGLAPIIGAFAAGVILGKLDDTEKFETQMRTIADIFMPLFFVYMGTKLDLALLDPRTATGVFVWQLGLILTLAAIIGKVAGGLTLMGKGLNKLFIGIGMVPRGEVGLIFAAAGKASGVVSDEVFASVLIVVALTTFFTPPALGFMGRRMLATQS